MTTALDDNEDSNQPGRSLSGTVYGGQFGSSGNLNFSMIEKLV